MCGGGGGMGYGGGFGFVGSRTETNLYSTSNTTLLIIFFLKFASPFES